MSTSSFPDSNPNSSPPKPACGCMYNCRPLCRQARRPRHHRRHHGHDGRRESILFGSQNADRTPWRPDCGHQPGVRRRSGHGSDGVRSPGRSRHGCLRKSQVRESSVAGRKKGLGTAHFSAHRDPRPHARPSTAPLRVIVNLQSSNDRPRHRLPLVPRLPVLDHRPRGHARLGGDEGRRPDGLPRRPGVALADPAHPARAHRHARAAAADGDDPGLGHRLGQRPLRSLLGGPVSKARRGDGRRGPHRQPDPRRHRVHAAESGSERRLVHRAGQRVVQRRGRIHRRRHAGVRRGAALDLPDAERAAVRVQPAAAAASGRLRCARPGAAAITGDPAPAVHRAAVDPDPGHRDRVEGLPADQRAAVRSGAGVAAPGGELSSRTSDERTKAISSGTSRTSSGRPLRSPSGASRRRSRG